MKKFLALLFLFCVICLAQKGRPQQFGTYNLCPDAPSANDGLLWSAAFNCWKPTTTVNKPPCSASITTNCVPTADASGNVAIGDTVSTVTVGGVTRAIKYTTSAGVVSRIHLMLDAAVSDYGDGNTVGSIRWAVDQLPANRGGHVHLGSGSFPVRTEITISKTNVMIEGEGNATWLYVPNGANPTAVIHYYASGTAEYYFCRLRNFQIEGNKTQNPTAGPGIWVSRADTGEPNDIEIDTVFVQNCKGHGIAAEYNWGTRIRNVLSEFNDGNGIYLASGLQVYLDTIFASYNALSGVRVNATDTAEAVNIHAYMNTQWGVQTSGTNGTWSNLHCRSNSVGSALYGGLYVAGADNVISNAKVLVSSVPNYGVLVQADRNHLSGIYAAGSGALGDIYMDAAADDNVISNSRVSLYADAGLRNRYEANSPVTYTAATPALPPHGTSYIDTSLRDVAATLANGKFVGQTVTITLTDATNSANGGTTVTIANHETSSPEVATFTAVGETLQMMWNGAKWMTLKATCTF